MSLLLVSGVAVVSAFQPVVRLHSLGSQRYFSPVATPHSKRASPTTTTSLNMFMGSDGGILGVGAPEVVSSKNCGAVSTFSDERE